MPKADKNLSKERGGRVKQLLHEQNVRQIELADKIGVTPEHLNAILNGKRTLTFEHAQSIAKLFNVRFEWVMCFDDFRTEDERICAALSGPGERLALIERLMGIHGYTHKEQYDKEICSYIERIHLEYSPDSLSDDEILQMAHQKEDFPDPVITVLGPNGKESHINYCEYRRIVQDIDDYIEMRLSFLFLKPVDPNDFLEETFGKYGRQMRGNI